MSSSTRKRKHRPRPTAHENAYDVASQTTANVSANTNVPDPDPALFIQAHEADMIRGPQARIAAKSLEVDISRSDAGSSLIIGDGLIRWGSARQSIAAKQGVMEDPDDEWNDEQEAIWVDRYDARLLLDALPSTSQPIQKTVPGSPSGWSDLPSDTEDTFFFAPDEADEYRRDKRRRVIDQNRDARLKALRDTGRDDEPEEEIWGGSDEEADESQRELMRRTATHILSSPNPAQLEMRILANHGGDKRFAFLRGRWAHVWKLEKGKVMTENAAKKQNQDVERTGVSLGVLADYGDSNEEDEEEYDKNAEKSTETKGDEAAIDDGLNAETDAAVKEARRVRAKEWAEKRRALTSNKS